MKDRFGSVFAGVEYGADAGLELGLYLASAVSADAELTQWGCGRAEISLTRSDSSRTTTFTGIVPI